LDHNRPFRPRTCKEEEEEEAFSVTTVYERVISE
jgi:hypothetical protein